MSKFFLNETEEENRRREKNINPSIIKFCLVFSKLVGIPQGAISTARNVTENAVVLDVSGFNIRSFGNVLQIRQKGGIGIHDQPAGTLQAFGLKEQRYKLCSTDLTTKPELFQQCLHVGQ